MSGTSKRLSPQDLMFLYGETPSSMMHVASLMPFTPPADAPPATCASCSRTPATRTVSPRGTSSCPIRGCCTGRTQSWVVDDNLDIDYHVRRSALASPGDERELGILISRLHSHPIDFTRPPWELHFIEGLEGGRFAIYMKMHHSLVDGYTGIDDSRAQHVDRPDAQRTQPMFFNVGPPTRPAGTARRRPRAIRPSVARRRRRRQASRR